MFSVVYEHRHGTDVTPCATENDALRSACWLIANWFGEFPSRKLATLINEGKYQEALDFWTTLDHNETITITPSAVVASNVPPPHIEIDDYNLDD